MLSGLSLRFDAKCYRLPKQYPFSAVLEIDVTASSMRFVRHLTHVAIAVRQTSMINIFQAVAVHAGAFRRRLTGRHVSAKDVDALLDLAAANARTIASSEASLAEDLLRAMNGLPTRPREILLAALLEGQSYRALAKRFGVSVRQIEREIRRGIEHCARSRPRA